MVARGGDSRGQGGRCYHHHVTTAAEYIDSPGSRVFVASEDIYLGMRAAYYLYPLNVFWQLEDPEMPANKYMRPGD